MSRGLGDTLGRVLGWALAALTLGTGVRYAI